MLYKYLKVFFKILLFKVITFFLKKGLNFVLKVAHLIFGEFFEQGDLERQNFNKTPEVCKQMKVI